MAVIICKGPAFGCLQHPKAGQNTQQVNYFANHFKLTKNWDCKNIEANEQLKMCNKKNGWKNKGYLRLGLGWMFNLCHSVLPCVNALKFKILFYFVKKKIYSDVGSYVSRLTAMKTFWKKDIPFEIIFCPIFT